MFAFLVVSWLIRNRIIVHLSHGVPRRGGALQPACRQFPDLTFGMNATAFGRLHLNLVDAVYIGLLIAGVCRVLSRIQIPQCYPHTCGRLSARIRL